MSCVIYAIKNINTGGVYVGSTKYFKKRKSRHLRELRLGKHHSIYLQRSYNKHGEYCFDFQVIEDCHEDSLFERERYWIDQLKPIYNVGSVGGGDNYSNHPNKIEIRERLVSSLRTCRKPEPKFGKTNPNWRGGISKFNCPICGKPTGAYRPKTCWECFKSLPRSKRSSETCDKIRKSRTGGKSTKAKKVLILGICYESMRQAEKITGESYNVIRRKILSENEPNYCFAVD